MHFPGLRINNKDKVKDNNYRYDLVRKSEIRQTAFIAQENFQQRARSV